MVWFWGFCLVFGQWVFLSCEIGVGCLGNRFCLVFGGGFLGGCVGFGK